MTLVKLVLIADTISNLVMLVLALVVLAEKYRSA